MAQGIFCSNCSAARKPGSLFCSECGTKFPATVQPVTQPSSSVCKACGNPFKPGDKYCSKCLVKVPDSIATQVAQTTAIPATSPRSALPIATSAPASAAIKTAPLVKGSGKAIPAVETWQVEVTRRAGATKQVGPHVEVTEMIADSGIQVNPVSPSTALLEYPRISDTQLDGRSWGIMKAPPQSFTQTERMTVILDAVNKKMYCVYAPEIEYMPPIRGVTKFALAISDRMMMLPQAIPKVWARFSEGDYISNYRHLPVLIARDYASFFTLVPVTLAPPEKKSSGLLNFAKDLSKGMKDMQLQQLEGPRNPADKITTLAQVQANLTSLITAPPAITAIPYKQRVCSGCGSVLIFDPDENALFCPGCGVYTQRYGLSPREAWHLDFLVECEKKANKAPDENLKMMRRLAFCPHCSTMLKYIFIPQMQEYNAWGNHLWYCPHCVSECPEIMDHPLDRAHSVICSHCGHTDASLQRADVTICPSCGSHFMTAGWEAQSPMPETDPNEWPWERMNWALIVNYKLARQP